MVSVIGEFKQGFVTFFKLAKANLVPRGRDPFGQRRGSGLIGQGSRYFQRMTKGTPGDEVERRQAQCQRGAPDKPRHVACSLPRRRCVGLSRVPVGQERVTNPQERLRGRLTRV